MLIARTRPELDAALAVLRAKAGAIALVPTMGALHAGHVSLVEHARTRGQVVASIFVNPLQFGPAEDLARYPRDEAGDLRGLRAAGCALAWLPDAAEMYPPDDATLIETGGPSLGWEGERRPGHFRGVATVVAKLFGQVRPDVACFGEKDWQQLQVIRRVTADLCLPVQVLGVPTMRESDGLAMSSRNRFLSPEQRASAPLLYAALQRTVTAVQGGADAACVLRNMRGELDEAGLAVDYLALVAGHSLASVAKPEAGARLIAAVRLGDVRLLDNVAAG